MYLNTHTHTHGAISNLMYIVESPINQSTTGYDSGERHNQIYANNNKQKRIA